MTKEDSSSEIFVTGRLSTRPAGGERVLVVGDGPVARALGLALFRAGTRVERWWRKQNKPLPAADVLVLAVRDEALREVSTQVMKRVPEGDAPPILLHCAGAIPAEEAFSHVMPKPLGVGLLHPLRSLAGAGDDGDLAGTVFAVQGDDPGRDAALRLVRRVGGTPLELDAPSLARYHAAAVMVSNHSVGLVDAAVELLAAAGLPREQAVRALSDLLLSTVRNLREVGLPDALTGPIARGDVDVVARHLLSLAERREIASLYRATARRVAKVSADKGKATAKDLERIRALLVDGE
jgi:predicted short-subunit dehydrogenase-like oxidoreductase (DUF2520 family)